MARESAAGTSNAPRPLPPCVEISIKIFPVKSWLLVGPGAARRRFRPPEVVGAKRLEHELVARGAVVVDPAAAKPATSALTATAPTPPPVDAAVAEPAAAIAADAAVAADAAAAGGACGRCGRAMRGECLRCCEAGGARRRRSLARRRNSGLALTAGYGRGCGGDREDW